MTDPFELIGQLALSESPVQRRFPKMTTPRRAAIVHLPHHKTAMRQRLVPIGTAPCVANTLAVRTSVHHHYRRILPGRFEPHRPRKPSVEYSTVRAFELNQLDCRQLIFVLHRTVALGDD